MGHKASTVLVDNRLVLIRPIRADDASLEADFVRRLSSTTKYFRFFSAFKELPPSEIEELCAVDGQQSMAFIATISEHNAEMEVGVCRYAPGSREDVREMAITIADDWQHTGVAQILLDRLIASARQHGIRELYSVELADDQAMRDFAAVVGMIGARDPADAHQMIYSMSLR